MKRACWAESGEDNIDRVCFVFVDLVVVGIATHQSRFDFVKLGKFTCDDDNRGVAAQVCGYFLLRRPNTVEAGEIFE